MEIVIIFCLVVALLAGWIHFRDRLRRLEWRVQELTSRFNAQSEFVGEMYRKSQTAARPEPATPAPAPEVPVVQVTPVAPVVPVAPPKPAPVAASAPVAPRAVFAEPRAAATSAPRRDWETLLGGSW